MSWDIFVFGGETPPPTSPEPGWEPPPLGTKALVRKRLEECLPGLLWDGHGFGMYGADSAGFEIQLSETDGSIDFIILTIRGGDPFPTLRTIAKETSWHLVDDGMGPIDLSDPANSQWSEAQEYTRRALGDASEERE